MSLSTGTERHGLRSSARPTEFVWSPQPGPQHALVACDMPEVFFGGARGGGKTDGVLGKWAVKEKRYGHHFNARMFRREATASSDAIERAKQIYLPLGAKFNESKLAFRMPHGGRVSFGYLDNIADADAEQGQNRTDAWVDEAGQYALSAPIDRLFGALRSAAGVPTQLVLTANPGGSGQHWLAERYGLVPFPAGPKIVTRVLPGGYTRQAAVIPSRITDNRILLDADPGYVLNLRSSGSEQLVKAWLNGDWSAIEGAFFGEWDEARHVVEPFSIPDGWLRFRSMDWGSAAPFSVGWWAVCSDELFRDGGRRIPRGSLVRYREWYGASAPNVGLKLTAEEIVEGIARREMQPNGVPETIAYGVLDPSTFAQNGGPSIAERMMRHRPRVTFRKSDNTRAGKNGAIGGWDLVRHRLRGDGQTPMMFVFSTCKALIRQMAMAQHDPTNAEDLDTASEDHALDEARYGCLSRPWIPSRPGHEEPANRTGYSAPKRAEPPSILTM